MKTKKQPKDCSVCATCMNELIFEYVEGGDGERELYKVTCPTCGVKYTNDERHRTDSR